jgi:NADPH:quinone reductase-like Zn-dependent oxidoreductase
MTPHAPTMKAVVLPDFGAAGALRQMSVPEPAEGEVRVRVHAASVNGFDVSVAHGRLQGMMEHRFPVVLGKDFAGVVDAIGAGVTGFAPGDRVFGVVTKPYLGDGSFGEFVTTPCPQPRCWTGWPTRSRADASRCPSSARTRSTRCRRRSATSRGARSASS